ncbi:MAG: DNA polymerase III subunit delta [Eggerthia catenaformis]|uniref:DNA polymerase III subunit delta n=1 Tax=Eggerthia catenaformis TaxID=31973 RepID=UPI00047BBC18|nr:DNA polymerase III subunit delta [Eggerthia catenaformis]
MNIVIYGNEKLLMKQQLAKLKKKYHTDEENMSFIVYYLNETSMSEILSDALTPPFLSEYKMIVLRQPIFLTSEKQKEISEEDIIAFIDYLAHDNPTTIFVIYHDVMNFDKRKKAVKALRKYAKFYEIEKVNRHDLYKLAREAIKKREAIINDDALNLLLERTGDDLEAVSNQVEKLCLYTKNIQIQDVNRLVSRPIEENVFALTNAILSHDLSQVSFIYHDLMISNHEPIALIALIAHSLRNLYQVKLLERKGYSDKEMVSILGLNPRAVYPIRMNAKKFEIDDLLYKLHQLSELDVKIKTGMIDKKKGLELFLMSI